MSRWGRHASRALGTNPDGNGTYFWINLPGATTVICDTLATRVDRTTVDTAPGH